MQKQLRYYQREAKKAAFKGWADYRTELIHIATGAGKTPTAAKMIGALCDKGKRCLYVADSTELCQQPIDAIYSWTGRIPALEKASDRAPLAANIVVASAQTLSRKERLERFPRNHFDAILTDEIHRGPEIDAVIHDYFETAHVCGFTATPHRKGMRDLAKYYEHVCYRLPMLDVVSAGFAPRLIAKRIPIEIDLSEVHKTTPGEDGKDYNAGELETTIEPYYVEAIKAIKREAAGMQTIVFLPLVRSSKAFADICRREGLSARHVDGSSPDRSELIEGFNLGRFQVITNADLLGTGVDLPSAQCLVNLCPTRSLSRMLQRVGRIMRVLPGVIDDLPEKDQAEERKSRIAASAKPFALFLDFLFQDDDFGIISGEHIFANSPEQARAMYEKTKGMSEVDLEAIARLVQEEKENQLVEALEKSAAKAGKGISYDWLALNLRDMDLMNWEPIARWHSKPATVKQIDFLARMGISAADITSGQASMLMEKIFERQKAGLCTFKQMRFLKRQKIDNADQLSFKSAAKLIDAIHANFRG